MNLCSYKTSGNIKDDQPHQQYTKYSYWACILHGSKWCLQFCPSLCLCFFNRSHMRWLEPSVASESHTLIWAFYGLMTSLWYSECIRTSISLIIYIQQPRLIFTVQINPILRCWCGTVQSGVIYACVFSPDECRAFNVVSPMYDDKRNGIFKQTCIDGKGSFQKK